MKKDQLFNFFAVFVLLTISIFNFIDRSILAPNYNLIMAEFNITQAQMGLVTTLFAITTAVCTVGFGFLNDRVNRKWLLFAGGIYYSVFTFLTSYAPSYVWLLIFKIFTGAGIGVILPVTYSIISDMFKSSSRGKVFAVFGIATTIGDAIGVILSGIYGTAGDWRTPFKIVGIINFFAALLVIFLRNPKKGAKEEILQDVLSKEGVDYSFRIKKEDLKYVYTRKTNFFLIINFVDNIPGGIILAWSITWLAVEKNLPKNLASELFLLAAAFSLVGSVAGGVFGDKWFKNDKRARVKISMIAMILEIPFLIIAVVIPFHFGSGVTFSSALSYRPFLIALLMFGIFFFIDSWIGPNWYSTIMDVNMPEHRGTMLSLANLVDAVGAGIGPFIGGLMYVLLGSYQMVFIYATIINIFGFILWIPMYFNVKKDIADVENLLKQRREEIIEKQINLRELRENKSPAKDLEER